MPSPKIINVPISKLKHVYLIVFRTYSETLILGAYTTQELAEKHMEDRGFRRDPKGDYEEDDHKFLGFVKRGDRNTSIQVVKLDG